MRRTFRWLKVLEVNGAGGDYKLCNQDADRLVAGGEDASGGWGWASHPGYHIAMFKFPQATRARLTDDALSGARSGLVASTMWCLCRWFQRSQGLSVIRGFAEATHVVGFDQLFPTSESQNILRPSSTSTSLAVDPVTASSSPFPSLPVRILLPATTTLLISWLYCTLVLIVAMLCHLYSSTTPPAYFVNCYSTFRICDSESGF